MMMKNPLLRLREYGQSVWLDLLSRKLIQSGQLQQLIDSDGLSGVTSNPAIFEKAIGSGEYEADIRALLDKGKTPLEIYEELAVKDIQEAADLLRPIYDQTGGADGFVSLEVSPRLAHDTQATVHEAKRLWIAVHKPNVMIKIPGTQEGLRAITESIADGINVNVTLLFGLPRYRDVTEAFIRGLEQRVGQGQDVRSIYSVASFFLSRIDVLIDPQLEEAARTGAAAARDLRGHSAIASAKIAYQMYKEIFGGERFRKLEQKGARKQRLLWGSTSTKTPGYSDVKYVEPLIGPETVNTMPPETLEAYRDHGNPELRLEQDVDASREIIAKLGAMGIDIDAMTQKLEEEGVEKFVKPFDKLLRGIGEKARSLQTS